MIKRITLACIFILFICNITLAQRYKNGCFYTLAGDKVEGLIKQQYATPTLLGVKPNYILYKENKKSKPITLTINDIKAFCIGTDSFTTILNLKINNLSIGKIAKDFVQVIDTGKIHIYKHYYITSSPTSSTTMHSWTTYDYYILKDNSEYYIIKNFYKQRKETAGYFVNRPDIQTLIIDCIDDSDFESMVKDYNSKHQVK